MNTYLSLLPTGISFNIPLSSRNTCWTGTKSFLVREEYLFWLSIAHNLLICFSTAIKSGISIVQSNTWLGGKTLFFCFTLYEIRSNKTHYTLHRRILSLPSSAHGAMHRHASEYVVTPEGSENPQRIASTPRLASACGDDCVKLGHMLDHKDRLQVGTWLTQQQVGWL